MIPCLGQSCPLLARVQKDEEEILRRLLALNLGRLQAEQGRIHL